MQCLALLNSPTQWLILIIVCLVIFGAKRLPEIARGLGKSLGEFKKARREFEDELMGTEATAKPAPKPLENSVNTVEVEAQAAPREEKQPVEK